MAFTSTQLAALEEAIALGARSVTMDGKTVQYSSSKEMLELRDRMRRELGLVAARPSVGFGRFSRGGS